MSDDNYELDLTNFETYNTIPNINSTNNKFYFDDNGEVIEIPFGSYEVSAISAHLRAAICRKRRANVTREEKKRKQGDEKPKTSDDDDDHYIYNDDGDDDYFEDDEAGDEGERSIVFRGNDEKQDQVRVSSKFYQTRQHQFAIGFLVSYTTTE